MGSHIENKLVKSDHPQLDLQQLLTAPEEVTLEQSMAYLETRLAMAGIPITKHF